MRYYDAGDNEWYEYDGPSARELAEDADADIERHSDEESFDAHYADEIELPGLWETADFLGGDPDERSYAERLTNAPGQLRLSLGAAY